MLVVSYIVYATSLSLLLYTEVVREFVSTTKCVLFQFLVYPLRYIKGVLPNEHCTDYLIKFQ